MEVVVDDLAERSNASAGPDPDRACRFHGAPILDERFALDDDLASLVRVQLDRHATPGEPHTVADPNVTSTRKAHVPLDLHVPTKLQAPRCL
jgi:hypothetical protein